MSVNYLNVLFIVVLMKRYYVQLANCTAIQLYSCIMHAFTKEICLSLVSKLVCVSIHTSMNTCYRSESDVRRIFCKCTHFYVADCNFIPTYISKMSFWKIQHRMFNFLFSTNRLSV